MHTKGPRRGKLTSDAKTWVANKLQDILYKDVKTATEKVNRRESFVAKFQRYVSNTRYTGHNLTLQKKKKCSAQKLKNNKDGNLNEKKRERKRAVKEEKAKKTTTKATEEPIYHRV